MTHRILLVEEHELSRYAAAELLQDSGFEVTEAVDEMEALALLHRNHFDLAIIGIVVPCPGSFGLLVWARLKWPDMPIIIAGHLSKSEIEDILLGRVTVIHKPIDRLNLVTAVTETLRDERGTIQYH
jgi:DNA-binding response OmpR family regulator